MRCLILISLAAFGLYAQSEKPFSVSAGLKAGSPVNDPSSQSSVFGAYTQGRWTGGPTIELHLPYHFSVEFDALYRSYRTSRSYPFQLGPNVNPYNTSSSQTTNVWDLPLLLKYRFRVGAVRPFVTAGYFKSYESSKVTAMYICSGPQGSCRPADYPSVEPFGGQYHFSDTKSGPIAGAGIEFKTGYLTVSPEVRFSRPTWGNPRDNRFTALVGFTFGKKR
jgi:hypothetical protein